MITRRRRVAALTVVGALVVLPIGVAHATFPGDNGRIAFSQGAIIGPTGAEPGDLGAHSQIFTIKPGGGKVKQLTHVPQGHAAASPDWSPDGEKIAYESSQGRSGFHIWVMAADGSHQHRVTRGEMYEDLQPSWSPNGTQLIFSHCPEPLGFMASCDIARVDADGTDLATLISEGSWFNVRPVYSPDGNQIAFGSDRDGHQSAIWVADANGNSPTRITDPSLRAFWPDWSPDGNVILFSDNCCLPHSNLWTVEPNGNNLDQVTNTPPDLDTAFGGYSPDGQSIVTMYSKGCHGGPCTHFFTLDVDGGNLNRVETGKKDTVLTDWGPAG